MKLKRNAAQCKRCKTVIESVTRHDFKFCKCESIFVDGGKDYIRRGAINPDDIIDLCEWVDNEEQS